MRHKPKLKHQSPDAVRLFAEFGLATFCAQELEAALFTDLIYSRALAREFSTISALDKAVTKHKVLPMGDTFRRLEKHLDDEHLGKMIKHALVTRNALAHHFFAGPEHGLLMTQEDIAGAVDTCHGAVKEFKTLTARLEERYATLFTKLAADPDAYVPGLAGRFKAAESTVSR